MPQPRIATTRVVTEINRTAILDALLEHGPLSRKQIVQRTGLSSATVERLSAALLSENLIAVDGLERSSGGRPSYLLRYAGSSRAVAAIDRLWDATTDVEVWPVQTNAGFLGRLCSDPDFRSGAVDTGLIARRGDDLTQPPETEPAALHAVAAALVSADESAPWTAGSGSPW